MAKPKIDRDAVVRLRAQGLTIKAMCARLGCPRSSLCAVIRELGLPDARKHNGGSIAQLPTPKPESDAAPRPGYSRVAEIAETQGVSLTLAMQIFHRERVQL
jgi:hypothetical protein